ncbi:hypothetical protein RJ640_007353 [Escallonia rubra]|uniref:Integrase catalytic domain-containing protein n=1 Tax=Escallonia rubra TaxID=112253 RepID=A0AA88UKG2_9ASTE|nr:hypothetical protein RJ640_007353 [Escallonia rubra]
MDAHEAHLFSMDDKAMNIISCGLDMKEYNRVSACETAREMWRLLEVTHEGTNQVKETKINMLVQQYEAFKMKEHESINEMYSRFTLIINGQKLLESSDDSHPEMALITRRFKKFLASKTGHIKKYCPQLKNKTASSNSQDFKEKKFKPRKAMLTWDDSNEDDKETSEDDDVAQLCFMAKDDHSDKVCLKARLDSNKWILDSGCSRHMTGDHSLFSHITLKNGGLVTLRDNSNGKIIGKGKIGTGSISIDNVSLVDGLKFNLISIISQLTDSGHKVQFEGDQCLISHASDGGTLVGKRDGNIYTLSFDASDSSREVCLSAQHNDIWLWHRRLGHVHMDLIKKLLSKELVRGLPKLKFVKDKDEVFEKNFSLVKQLQNEKELKLVKIRSDHGGEFEKDFIPFCIQNGISHEFSAPRTPQQNGVVEKESNSSRNGQNHAS